jgi:hypothetical protein
VGRRVLGIPHDIRRKVIGGGKEGNKPRRGGEDRKERSKKDTNFFKS